MSADSRSLGRETPRMPEPEMSEQVFPNPYGFTAEDFAPRGAIALSSEALADAKEFVRNLQRFEPSSRWIAGFAWCYARTMRESSNSELIDEGPGIDLAGYRTSEIPDDAVELYEGVPVVFIIPRDKIDAAKRKEIVQTRLTSKRLSFVLE